MRPGLLASLTALALGACSPTPIAMATDDETRRGERALRTYGCGACHRITGIPGARGNVGPPLDAIRARAYVAGRLPASPANLARWIEAPQRVLPGSAMPDMGVTRRDAEAMAAWLWKAP